MDYDLIIRNARIATMRKDTPMVEHASLAIKNGVIQQVASGVINASAQQTIDASNQLVTPGLIDCHTHLVYAGNRADEFSMRLKGATYVDIAQAGGGIMSTVKATREASVEELTALAVMRAEIMLKHGTTTVEIKSGYGLDLETEIKILAVAQLLETKLNISVIGTFLGAHAVPPEYKKNSDAYIDDIISHMLPIISERKLAKFVDAFCESIAFSPAQVERLFVAAQQYGFQLKLHAEQLTDQKGALLAAQYGAKSVDHLEFLSSEDCQQLATHNTVAVLLPGAFYFLKEHKQPPIAALRAHHIPMAIATDSNPGTSPFLTLPLMMNMGCLLFGLTMDEVWHAVTINAAKALDIDQQVGSIERGKRADLIIWSCKDPHDIVYNPSINYCHTIVKAGKIV